MPLQCTRRERHRCIWSSLVAITAIACILIVFISLKYTSYENKSYERRTNSADSFKAEKLTDEECVPTCFTKACVLHANYLNNRIDPSVDQCEDFSSFMCGKYVEKFGKEENGYTFEDLTRIHFLELKDLLDNLEADPESASGKMKTVYDSCMDLRTSELSAMSSVDQFLEKVGIPNWQNLSEDFQFTEPSLPKALGILAAYREFSFLQFFTQYGYSEPEFNGSIEMSDMFKYSKLFDEESVRERAAEYVAGNRTFKEIMEMFKAFGPYFEFGSNKHCKWENATNVYIDCSQENESSWRMLCEILETFVDVANVSERLSKDHIFIPCSKVKTVKNILRLLLEVPHRTIAYFLGFPFFISHLDDLHLPLRLILQDGQAEAMKEYILHDPLPLPHWEHCVYWIKKNMLLALGHEYTKNVITEPVLRQVNNMFEDGFKEVTKMVLHQDWLTEEGKSKILRQFDRYHPTSVELEIRYFLNETFVNQHYEQFHPVSGSFLENVLERQKSFFTVDIDKYWEYPDLHELTPFNVNGQLHSRSVELGLGNFRFPTIVPEDPLFLNSLRLAAVIGHEIGHIIEYDVDSTLNFAEKMEDFVTCFEMQYSNFTIESLGINVDAVRTAAENYADSVSIILLDKYIEKYLPSADAYVLPSIPYTTKQLIYIMHSEMMCSKYSKEREEYLHDKDYHPLDHFRITAMMQNSEGYSKAFNCSKGSYMNPSTKCLMLREN